MLCGPSRFKRPSTIACVSGKVTSARMRRVIMNQTFQNSAQVLSIGIFFTLMIVGLSSSLPHTMASGLEAHGVPAVTADRVAALPPVSILFAAFLGYNPIQSLLGAHTLGALSLHDRAMLTGPRFFPQLISEPFRHGLHTAFAFSIIACLVAAAASALRGGVFHHGERLTLARPEEQHAN